MIYVHYKTYEKEEESLYDVVARDSDDPRDDTIVFVRNSNFSIDTRPHESLGTSPKMGTNEFENQLTSLKVTKGTDEPEDTEG